MRAVLSAALLASAVCAGTLGSEAEGFLLEVPADWVRGTRDGPKAHVRTFFGDDPEGSRCDAMLYVYPTCKEPLRDTAAAWRRDLETTLGLPAGASEGTLDGVPCHVLEFRGEGARWTYRLAAKGGRLYVFLVERRGGAVGDKEIDADVGRLVASLRLLAREPAGADALPPAPAPEADAGEELSFDHWRLRCARPAGLRRVEPTPDEAAAGIVLRLEGRGDQHACVIRVHAHLAKGARHRPVADVAEWLQAHFEKEHTEDKRQPVERGTRWEVPLAKETRTLRLVAKEAVLVTRLWYLADCRNDRQYRVEVTLRGAGAEAAWKRHVEAFLQGFLPQRD